MVSTHQGLRIFLVEHRYFLIADDNKIPAELWYVVCVLRFIDLSVFMLCLLSV